jgi:nucleoside diphosphate kinase
MKLRHKTKSEKSGFKISDTQFKQMQDEMQNLAYKETSIITVKEFLKALSHMIFNTPPDDEREID